MNPPLAFTPLPRSFCEPSADIVATRLLGHWLIRNTPQGPCGGPIVETEAYLGPHDLASHASKGRTKRTEVMFGPAGRAYVYLIYGIHEMLNVVVGRVGEAEAVLIRDGTDTVVYVEKGPRTFHRRAVTVGRPSDGRVQVLSGLEPGERVVVKGALLLDGAADQLL